MAEVAVLSDIHGNVEALSAVMKETRGLPLYCLGDFVDYGAEPNEVIGIMRDREAVSVLGNHDHAALTGETSMFNALAAISSAWSRERLEGSSKDFLGGLPLSKETKIGPARVYFTHGSPDDNLWEYVDPRTHHLLFGHYLSKLRADLIGLGHTHVPYVWKENSGVVFNPGSVGQPRDGDRRASFAVVKIEGGGVEVEIKRVEYDYQKAASKIRAAGLPVRFAERLATGS